jgi:peptidoglycan/LPS O-acetylase OafA/YrhL
VSSPKKVGYLQNIQVLRFVAAIWVLLSHLEHETLNNRIPGMTPAMDPTGIAWKTGVDVFFVISGFIMYYMTAGRGGSWAYAGEFLKRRIIRVVPMYWLFTTLMLAAIILVPGRIQHLDATPARTLASYFFIPMERADGHIEPILAAGWTINYEMFFYACFAMALLWPRAIGLYALFLAFTVAVIFGRFGPKFLEFWTNPIIIEFLFGIFLAYVYRTGRVQFNAAIVCVGVLIGVGLLAYTSRFDYVIDRWIWAGVPALILAASFALGPNFGGRTGKLLALGGDASYALYLSHPFSLNVLAVVWTKAHLPLNGWAYVVAGLVCCTAAAWFIHLWVERPLLGFLRSRFETKKQALVVA